MKKFLLSLALVNCWSVSGCASSAKYPASDHYDGNRFFNPTQTEHNGFWRTLKLLVSVRFKDWPNWIENTPDSKVHEPIAGDEVSVTFINHATVLIQTKGLNILTDPVWCERVSPVSWAGPKRKRDPGISLEGLPKIDLVLVSHNHYDHLDLETLRKLQEKFAPQFLVPLGDKKLLAGEGIANVEEMDWWDKLEFKDQATITFAPTQHLSARGVLDWNKSLWGSFMIDTKAQKIYFGGDAGYSTHYKEIRRRLGEPDISFLPIGAYEPRWFMKPVHMNPADAVQAHLDLGSKHSIGIHFGTFQQVDEAFHDPAIALEAAKKEVNLLENSFVVLKEGVTKFYPSSLPGKR